MGEYLIIAVFSFEFMAFIYARLFLFVTKASPMYILSPNDNRGKYPSVGDSSVRVRHIFFLLRGGRMRMSLV